MEAEWCCHTACWISIYTGHVFIFLARASSMHLHRHYFASCWKFKVVTLSDIKGWLDPSDEKKKRELLANIRHMKIAQIEQNIFLVNCFFHLF